MNLLNRCSGVCFKSSFRKEHLTRLEQKAGDELSYDNG